MKDKHTRVIEITGDNPRVVEQIYHQLVKECNNAGRWGHDVEVRRVELTDKNIEGFDE